MIYFIMLGLLNGTSRFMMMLCLQMMTAWLNRRLDRRAIMGRGIYVTGFLQAFAM